MLGWIWTWIIQLKLLKPATIFWSFHQSMTTFHQTSFEQNETCFPCSKTLSQWFAVLHPCINIDTPNCKIWEEHTLLTPSFLSIHSSNFQGVIQMENTWVGALELARIYRPTKKKHAKMEKSSTAMNMFWAFLWILSFKLGIKYGWLNDNCSGWLLWMIVQPQVLHQLHSRTMNSCVYKKTGST